MVRIPACCSRQTDSQVRDVAVLQDNHCSNSQKDKEKKDENPAVNGDKLMYLYNCFFSLFLNLFGGCYALPNWARPIFSGSKNLPQICTDRFSGKLTVNRNSRTQAIMGQSALPIKLGNLLFGPDRSEQSTFNLEPSEPSLSGCIISASLLFSVLLGRMHNIEYHLSFGCPWLPIEYGIYWNIDTQSSLAPPQPLDSLYIYTPVFPTSAGQIRSLMGIHP